MKTFFLVSGLLVCFIAYIRFMQPDVWNTMLTALQAAKPSDISTNTVASPPVVVKPPVVATEPTEPVPDRKNVQIITPDSAFLNPDHIKAVEQPAQPAANAIASSPKEFVPPDPIPEQPNWTWTVMGRDYHNVVVTKVEADTVSITYDGGIGTINTSDLTPDLQKMFNYDPTAASQAANEKAAEQAKIAADEAPKIAALKAQEQAQAAADEAQRKMSIQNETTKGNVGDAEDQKRQIQNDVNAMLSAKEVYVDSKTGQAYGTNYWVDKHNADEQGIAKCDQVINSGGR